MGDNTGIVKLDQFVRELGPRLSKLSAAEKKESILQFYNRLEVSKADYARYVHPDPSQKYTRNLVSTDDSTYTLLLLVWSPSMESPIHDHPCDGCWMRILEGNLEESRYVLEENKDSCHFAVEAGENGAIVAEERPRVKSPGGSTLRCTTKENYEEGSIAFIEDAMGYHKIRNTSDSEFAVSLHLYSPPFDQCKFWPSQGNGDVSLTGNVCFHSEYGELVQR